MDAEFVQKKLIRWYAHHHRRLPWRDTGDPYAIWISEVMLQQTQVATAIPYYERFLKRFPSPAALAVADLDDVLKMWEGLGYYSRARNLHRAAGIVVAEHHGTVPDDPIAFRALPGVGDYIAAAVLSIAFGRVMAVVDGNVKRVLARLLEEATPVNHSSAHKIFKGYADKLICPRQPSVFNQAMMELGALICRPKTPDCDHCPVSEECLAYRHHTTGLFPKRIEAKKKPRRHQAITVILKGEKMLVVQRPKDGLLGGLWEFPAIERRSGKDVTPKTLRDNLLAEVGLKIERLERFARIRHAYTHFSLTADVYLCRWQSGRVRLRTARQHRWVSWRGLHRLPLHKANHKFLDQLGRVLGKM